MCSERQQYPAFLLSLFLLSFLTSGLFLISTFTRLGAGEEKGSVQTCVYLHNYFTELTPGWHKHSMQVHGKATFNHHDGVIFFFSIERFIARLLLTVHYK